MNFISAGRFFRKTLAGLLLVSGIGLLWLYQRGTTVKVTPLAAPTVAANVAPAKTAAADPLPDASTEKPVGVPPPVSHAQETGLVSVPESVRRAFLSITGRIEDWREFRPDKLTVAPYPDLPIEFTRTALKDEGKYVTWIGRNPAMPGASFVGVATANGYDAILVIPGASQFSFHVRGEEVVMSEASPGEESCGDAPQPVRKVSVPKSAADILAVSYAPGVTPLPDNYAETAPLHVDVLVGYDPGVLTDAATKSSDPVGYIDGQSKAMLETSNLALAQSLVSAFSWRYLGSVAVPAYTRTGKSADDLLAINPSGELGDWVTKTRYQRGADQFIMLVGGSMDAGGRGYSSKQVAVNSNFAVSVMHWGNSAYTMAHELTHNFGGQHDRDNAATLASGDAGPVPDGDGFWCYGHLWVNPPVPTGFAEGTTGDIMSYADWRIPYFSNPNVTVHVTGSLVNRYSGLELGTHQIGRVESDPRAAYVVRVLNEQATVMSNSREEIVAPVITTQPRGLSVQKGQYFIIYVTATGGGLAYQWMKNGIAIAGATNASYAKTSDDTDAGTYSVEVSNYSGRVVSDSAAVTLVTAQPPATTPPSSSGGSGGGGGGGALGLSFYVSLGGCLLVRWLAMRRRAGM